MGERAVSFGHTVHVFLTFEGTALVLISVDYFSGELVGHSLTATFAGVDYEIFHGNRLFAVGTDFRGDLEGSATYAAALNLHLRSNVLESFLPDLEAGFLLVGEFFLYVLQSCVEDGEGNRLLAVVHEVVDEFGHLHFVEFGIREYDPFLGFGFSHFIEKVVFLFLAAFYIFNGFL